VQFIRPSHSVIRVFTQVYDFVCNSWYILFRTHDVALLYCLKAHNLLTVPTTYLITRKLSHYLIPISCNLISTLKRRFLHYLFVSKIFFHLHIVRYCKRRHYNTTFITATSRNSCHRQTSPPSLKPNM
jgi:hypothetical protein